MIRDMTLGQYYPVKSVIHELDPRVKLFATFIYIVALFTFRGLAGFALVTAGLFSVIRISEIPLGYMVKGLKTIMTLLMITVFFNLFFTKTGTEYWHWGIFHLTSAGITSAVLMTIRFIYLILGTSLMTLTTTANALTDGLEKSLACLNRIHVPVHSLAMMMSIALRFIPILTEETDRIMKAQMARAADFESGNLIRRAKNMLPILIPLFVSAFRRADDLAMAMESRCYTGGEGRTKMKPLKYEKIDRIAYLAVIVFFILVIVFRIMQ